MFTKRICIGTFALILLAAGATSTHASFHKWELRELYTNADGTVQFIELFTSVSGEQFTQNTTLRSSQDATIQNYNFSGNTPSPTNNHRLLLATSGFAALSGAPTPDFIIPDGFLFFPNGSLVYISSSVSANYSNLPTDGINSLHFPGATIAPNTPTNFAGTEGAVSAGSPIINPLPAIPQGTIRVELQTIVTGLTSPLGVVGPDDGSGRLFVYDQAGMVTAIVNGQPLATPFLDVSGRLVSLGVSGPGSFDERGLIGLAFHPDFANNPKVYTYTSEPVDGPADFTNGAAGQNHQAHIAEWTLTGASAAANTVDMASLRPILRIDEPQFNHDGGTLRFGPDGFLYISLGDGGAGDDQGDGHVAGGNGQDNTNIYGTLLRIDVDRSVGVASTNGQYNIPPDNPFVGAAGMDEIFVYGLRNPYAFSFDIGKFDTQNYEIFIGDAGQNHIEEIDLVTAANVGGNYGWRFKEGSFFFDPNAGDPGFVTTAPPEPVPNGLIDPIAEYDHGDGIVLDNGTVVIGGFVYRGSEIPELAGVYVCGDFGPSFSQPAGRLWYLDAGNNFLELIIGEEDRPLGLFLKGFGQDADGEIYVCGSQDLGPFGTSGVVLKLIAVPESNAASANWMKFK